MLANTCKEVTSAESRAIDKKSKLNIKEINVSDKMSAGWGEALEMQELGGDCYWLHHTSQLEKPLSTRMGVAGHVNSQEEHAAYYQDVLKADLEVVKWVRHGYELTLKEWPQSSFTKNNRSALEDPSFVWNEIQRLCLLGVMEEVEEKPHVVNALSVVFSNKKRLVWDVRELNKLIEPAKLPLETLDDAAELLEKDSYGATSDLEAGYFQVGIAVKCSAVQRSTVLSRWE
jgi:hypothetical protein